MVGPKRPQFVLFGSSIVQYSFGDQGWGAILADIYSRKADILVRGYGGWNSRNALQVLHQVFPKDAPVQPSLIIVYFGGNDSFLPHPNGLSPHVPLPEYIENMRKIALHLMNLSEKTRLIFLGAPAVNEEMMHNFLRSDVGRTNEQGRIYSEACLKICEEMDVKAIDLWTAMQQRHDWLTACFVDGLHLSAAGSQIVVKEILKVIREAEWEPSLYWKSLPAEFVDVSAFDPEASESQLQRYLPWE